MEFLTLQDVPHYHRSAMSFRDSARPQETSERMQVGHVLHHPSSPVPSLSTLASATPFLQSARATPSPPPPSSEAPGDSRALVPFSHEPQGRLYLVGDGWKAEVTAMRAMQDQAGVDALLAAAAADETRRAAADQDQAAPAVQTRTLPPKPPTPRTCYPREPTLLPPGPERLMDITPHLQRTVGLPPFEELARVADKPHEKQSVANVSSPATIGYWQTSSARNSRQSSTERPQLNPPTAIEFSNPFGAPGVHTRLPSSPENYTTRNDGKPPFLHLRSSPTHEHRRSSVRSEYEPRIPSLHSALPPPRTAPSGSGPLAVRPAGYHPSGAYSHQIPLPGEAPYAHHGYGAPYGHDHSRYRSSWVPETSGYQPRYQPRHDSTMVPHLDPRIPYSYPPPYLHSLEHGHHGMVDTTCPRRRRGNLPKEATQILKKWFQAHAESPYPTDEEKGQLAMMTGLASGQISNWFINARRRNPGKEAREAAKRAAQQARQVQEMDVDHDRIPQHTQRPPLQQQRQLTFHRGPDQPRVDTQQSPQPHDQGRTRLHEIQSQTHVDLQGPRPQPQDGLQPRRDRRRDNDQSNHEDREMSDA